MDRRKALPPGSVLDFPGLPCTVEREIGRGAGAIVYRASYPDRLDPQERHIVLLKELFPFDRGGGIYRDERGEIVCEPSAAALMELHRRSFAQGNRIHLRLLERHPELAGANLNTFPLHGSSYTVLGYSGGRSLAEASPGEAQDLRQVTRRLLGLLDALEIFHESGFLHLDIAPDNILLLGQGGKERVMLIDYNSAAEMAGGAAPAGHSVKAGYTAPEIRLGKRPEPSADLYSVAAVFFRCLTGRALTPFEASRPTPPEVAECACLRDVPDTVSSMVRQILRRGLQALPARRYRSVAQLRAAFQELLDRIDGVGLTHWAIWEGGRRMVARTVRDNPSLSYLLNEETLFPAEIRTAEGGSLPAGRYIEEALAGKRGSLLLTAPGGMGKTTALLRSVLQQGAAYTPSRPAAVYLSLYGWKAGDPYWIHDRILEDLRFKPGQRGFADARLALDRLLEEPLQTRAGERPVLLLLLDGLNEAVGEPQALIGEILSLSRMRGVSLLLATRGEEPAIPFPRAELTALSEETVASRLSENGLLLPQSPAVRELLRTPLMLSIFLRTALDEERQLSVQSREELIAAYLSALREKALRALPEGAEDRWQMEAALSFVLPAIAGELQKSGQALEDRELLAAVERCYRVLSSRLLRRAFPQWIGRGRAIRGGAANAEDWYGAIVHGLLWKRFGLLTRDERGRYQIAHQIIGDYLTGVDAQNRRRIRGRRRLGAALSACALALALLLGLFAYRQWIAPQPYNEIYAGTVLTSGLSGYVNAGLQYAGMRALLDCALASPERYAKEAARYLEDPIPVGAHPEETLEKLLSSGAVMPASGEPLDAERYRELLSLAEDRRAEYGQLRSILTYVMEDGRRDPGGSFPALLSELLETDADITAALYQLVCEPHIQSGQAGAEDYLKLVARVPEQNEHLSGARDPELLERWLATLRGKRAEIRAEIDSSGLVAAYEWEGGAP